MAPLALVHARFAVDGAGVDDATLVVDGGRIASAGPAERAVLPRDATILDARGLLAVPGYLDFHTHGALGIDYFDASPDEVARVLEWLPSTGVTGLLLTTTTAPPDRLLDAVRRLARLVDGASSGARVLGLHLEGPWIAPGQRGAQLASAVRPPDVEEFERLQEAAGGHIRAVSLAPEQPGAPKLIEHLARTGVVACAGHTDATAEQVLVAIERGLRHATHCFNAMRALHHREPGVVGAVLASDRLSADVVLDGNHVHPVAADVLFRAKGPEHVGLITDSMQATGLGDGTYVRPGNRRVIVEGGVVRLESGALAGSVLTLDQAVRNASAWLGLPLHAAARLASGLTARLLGLGRRKGTLEIGADADICLLRADGQVAYTIVGGAVVYGGAKAG